MIFAHVGLNYIIYKHEDEKMPFQAYIKLPKNLSQPADVVLKFIDDYPTSVEIHSLKNNSGTFTLLSKNKSQLVSGEINTFSSQIILEEYGVYSFNLTVTDQDYYEEISVPVNFFPQEKVILGDRSSKAIMLLFLFVLLYGIYLIFFVSSKSSTFNSKMLKRSNERNSTILFLNFTFFSLLIVFLGLNLKNDLKMESFQNNFSIDSEIEIISDGNKNYLNVQIINNKEAKIIHGDIIPDHGKMMHMFIISDDHSQMAHLHPVRIDEQNLFSVKLPSINYGKLNIFMDIAFESGLAKTLKSTVFFNKKITTPIRSDFSLKNDIDDSWLLAPKESGVIWINKKDSYNSESEIPLSFKVLKNGIPATIEPYIGMNGHIALLKKDENVFVHLHPTGTINMASKIFLENNLNINNPFRDKNSNDKASYQAHEHSNKNAQNKSDQLQFPSLILDKKGSYSLWVQVKVEGEVLTQKFNFELI